MCAVLLAFLVRDNWRLLIVLYTAPAVVFLSYWWIAPESIRWLVARGKNSEARRLIERAAVRNGVVIEERLIRGMEMSIEKELVEEEESKTYTAIDLFRYPRLRYNTIILMVCWVSGAGLYTALFLDQSELSDNKYLGFFINAAVQLPGYVYIILTLERPFFGRKRSMCLFLLLSGACLTSHPFVPASLPQVRNQSVNQ